MYGHRNPSWSFLLLDSEDRQIGTIGEVSGGRWDVGALTRLGGSASLSLDYRTGQDIDWMSDRVQAVYDPGIPGIAPWPRGTYLFTSPTELHSDGLLSFEVALQTKMAVVEADRIPARFSVAPGVNIVDTVVSLIQGSGESRISATPSGAVTPAGRTWEAGTPVREIANDLLATAGYWSLWCDASGLFRVEPWVDPALRPIVMTSRHGDGTSLHYSDWRRVKDDSGVPNRVIVRGQERQDQDPIEGVAENVNLASPYSFAGRGGRWIAADPYEGNDFADQSAADAYAQARLLDLMNPVARLDVMFAMFPVEPNELVEFIPADGVRRLATVQNMSGSFAFDTDISGEWREVIPV